jgi:hypothetical protein
MIKTIATINEIKIFLFIYINAPFKFYYNTLPLLIKNCLMLHNYDFTIIVFVAEDVTPLLSVTVSSTL